MKVILRVSSDEQLEELVVGRMELLTASKGTSALQKLDELLDGYGFKSSLPAPMGLWHYEQDEDSFVAVRPRWHEDESTGPRD